MLIKKHKIDYPVTSPQSPVPNHQSPITNHRNGGEQSKPPLV
ncbi:MAG: hypothetical protein ACKO9I_07645 [Sphaerospermopsis kisseleviana]